MSGDKVIYCNDCNYEFLLSAVEIKEADIELSGQTMTLVYFVCPHCGRLYKVAIKDERYKVLLEDLNATKARIRRCRGKKNFELASMLNNMVQKKAQRLREHMDKLNGKFTGTFVCCASENNTTVIKYIDRE